MTRCTGIKTFVSDLDVLSLTPPPAGQPFLYWGGINLLSLWVRKDAELDQPDRRSGRLLNQNYFQPRQWQGGHFHRKDIQVE
jgi:hypothetical protein